MKTATVTRNNGIYLQDLTNCDHAPDFPVLRRDGSVAHWLCYCGRAVHGRGETTTVAASVTPLSRRDVDE
jgi:hypothetical protein